MNVQPDSENLEYFKLIIVNLAKFMKYHMSTTSGCKDMWIIKSPFDEKKFSFQLFKNH